MTRRRETGPDAHLPDSRDHLEAALRSWVSAIPAGLSAEQDANGSPLRRGVSVSLEGHPGMGKSHLGRSVADLARAQGFRVVSARGRERLSRTGFGVVHELLGPTADGQDPGEAAFGRVDGWAAEGPVLCWVDDLHWADSASLATLRRLVWAARDLPLVLILAGRALPARESVTMVTRSVDHRLVLPPMSDMAVETMAHTILGEWPGPRLRAHLQACRGNPLFVADVLGALTAAGRLTPAGRERVDLIGQPPAAGAGLHAHLDSHLRGIGEAAGELLGALAVWGTAATPQDLADLLYVTPDAIRATVDAAVASGVAQWTEDRPEDAAGDRAGARLQFVHDLYQERADHLLEPGVRRAVHRRAAELRGTAGQSPAVIAQHLLLAADPETGRDGALLTALRAAAAEAGAWAPAVQAELLGDLRVADPGAEGDLVAVDQAQAHYAGGQQARAVEIAARHLAVTTDRQAAATLQTIVLRVLVNRGDTVAAGQAIERTLSVAQLPGGVRRQLSQLRCWVQVLAGERAAARASLAPLLDEARAAGDAEVEYGLLSSLAILEYLDARPATALDVVERQRGLALSDRAKVESRMTSLIWPPLFALYAHGPEVAQRVSVDARRTGARFGARWLDPFHSFVAAGIASSAGQWDDATAEGDTGLELAEEIGTGWTSLAVGERAGLDARRGHLAAARRRLDDFAATGFPWQFGSPDPQLADLLVLESGGAATATAAVAAARRLWSTAAPAGPLWMLRCAPDVARIALTRWDPDLAGRVAGDVAALPTTRIPLLAATPDLVGGMASGSVDQLVAAAEAATRAGNVPLAATAQEELAYAAGSAGRADIARPTLDLAVAAYQGMGARAGADRASARLRTVGIRRGSRAEHRTDRRGPASLTPTERRVTLLVRDGLTNPEIAARLFLSPRTVQTHVSHILAKLGARSRVEVARMDLPPGGVEG